MAENPTHKTPTNPNPETTGIPVFDHKTLQNFSELIQGFQAEMERFDTETKKFGDATNETKSKLEELNTKLSDMETSMQKKYDEVTAALHRKEVIPQPEAKKAKAIERKQAYFDVLLAPTEQKAEAALAKYHALYEPDERKEILLGDLTMGGTNAPVEFIEEMIRDLQEMNPVRGLFRSRRTDTNVIRIPKRTGFIQAEWVGEIEQRPETLGFEWTRLEIPVHELSALVKVSRQDLEDSFFDVEAEVRREMVEQFGRAEEIAFIDGNGIKKPQGFMANTDITFVTSSTAGVLKPDDLITVYYTPLTQYLANSTWVMERATIKEIRLMKDAEGRYLWAAALATDARPATILDRPYIAADQMPSIAAGNDPIAFGDFRQGYTVVDRIQLEMVTDIYSSKRTGEVEFSGRRRVGGRVVQEQAIVKLRIKS